MRRGHNPYDGVFEKCEIRKRPVPFFDLIFDVSLLAFLGLGLAYMAFKIYEVLRG